MAKPADTYQWASDVGVTADPGSTRKASGFVAGKKAPSKWFNWLHRGAGLWHAYLNNLHNESEFLNKAYAWTGNHTFTKKIALQADDGAHTIDVADSLLWSAPLARQRVVNLAAGVPDNAGGGSHRYNQQWEMKGSGSPSFNAGVIWVPVTFFGTGDIITAFSFKSDPNATDFTVELYKIGSFGGMIAGGTRAGGLGAGTITVPGLSEPVSNLNQYVFRCTCGSDDATAAILSEITVFFNEISPIGRD
jgi:hypothetical protein